jgi:hypothetical protein
MTTRREDGGRRPGTVADQLREWSSAIESDLPRIAEGGLQDWTRGSSRGIVHATVTPFAWSDLASGVRQHQHRLRGEYKRFTEMLRVLLREHSRDQLDQFAQDVERVTALIEREDSPFETPAHALRNAIDALQRQMGWSTTCSARRKTRCSCPTPTLCTGTLHLSSGGCHGTRVLSPSF